MKTILFPTDLSETSLSVLDYVIDMSKEYGAQLVMLHVYQPTMSPRRPFLEEGTIRRQKLRELFEFGRDRLRKIPPEMVKYRVEEGFTVPKLLSICYHESVNLIVIGRSNDNSWIYKYLLSKILNISGNAPCPVLIVPPNISYRSFQRISITYGQHPEIDRYIQSYVETQLKQESTFMQYYPVTAGASKSWWKNLNPSRKRAKLKNRVKKEYIDLMIMSTRGNFLNEWLQTTPIPRSIVFDLNIPVMVFNPNAIKARRIFMSMADNSMPSDIYDLTG